MYNYDFLLFSYFLYNILYAISRVHDGTMKKYF